MDLRRATLVLMFGTSYTVLHKVVHALVPQLGRSSVAVAVTSLLWTASTLALVLFALTFLIRVRTRARALRYSLIGIIVFTCVIVLSKLLAFSALAGGAGHRLVFSGASALNAIAMLVFAVSLARLVPDRSTLVTPLRLLSWCLGLSALLGLTATAYLTAYVLTGLEVAPLPLLQPLAMLSFLLTSGATLWFLNRFWRMDDHATLLPQ